MAYEPTIWKNREVEKPRTFQEQNNPDGTVTLIPKEGNVIEPGTPIIADTMNKMELGIKDAHDGIANLDLSELATKVELATHTADEAAHGIGNKATLLTANKTSIVGALNELFTNANSLKTDWASVVGSPLVSGDTSAQLKSKTQTIKNTLATNLTAKGQTSVGTETLTALATKIGNIPMGVPNATGTISTDANGRITVSGLSFTPKQILIEMIWSTTELRKLFNSVGARTGMNTMVLMKNGTTLSVEIGGLWTVASGGFNTVVATGGFAHTPVVWYAWG